MSANKKTTKFLNEQKMEDLRADHSYKIYLNFTVRSLPVRYMWMIYDIFIEIRWIVLCASLSFVFTIRTVHFKFRSEHFCEFNGRDHSYIFWDNFFFRIKRRRNKNHIHWRVSNNRNRRQFKRNNIVRKKHTFNNHS